MSEHLKDSVDRSIQRLRKAPTYASYEKALKALEAVNQLGTVHYSARTHHEHTRGFNAAVLRARREIIEALR